MKVSIGDMVLVGENKLGFVKYIFTPIWAKNIIEVFVIEERKTIVTSKKYIKLLGEEPLTNSFREFCYWCGLPTKSFVFNNCKDFKYCRKCLR